MAGRSGGQALEGSRASDAGFFNAKGKRPRYSDQPRVGVVRAEEVVVVVCDGSEWMPSQSRQRKPVVPSHAPCVPWSGIVVVINERP